MPAKAKATARSKSRGGQRQASPTKAVAREGASKSPTRAQQAKAAVKTRGKSGGSTKSAKPDVKMTAAKKKSKTKETKTAQRAPARQLRSAAKKQPTQQEDDDDDSDGSHSSEADAESDASSEIAQTQIIESDKKLKKITGAKKQIPATQATARAKSTAKNKSASKSKSPVKGKKQPPVKKEPVKPKRGQSSKSRQSKDIKDDEDEQMEAEDEQIDSAVRAADKEEGQQTTRSKSKPELAKRPEVGKKRRRHASESENEDDDADGGRADSSEQVPVKKRKVAANKVENIRTTRPKPPPKMPTVYKRGKWNPDIQIIQEDNIRDATDPQMLTSCCTRCNNRNVHRAALTGNEKLLNACIFAKVQITNLNACWGPDQPQTALEILLERADMTLLEALLHPKLKIQKNDINGDYDTQRAALYGRRNQDEPYLMNFVETGRVSHMAYGTAVRSVQMTRGNRQGNNAFLEDTERQKDAVADVDQQAARWVAARIFGVESFKVFEKLCGGSQRAASLGYDYKSAWSRHMHTIIRLGEYELASYLLTELVKHPHFGFNELHLNVLQQYRPGVKLPEFKYVSVAKKATSNLGMTPLHFACINPDVEVLKQLLAVNPDFNMQDTEMRRPIHYAAACEGTAPLKYLLEKGANLLDVDSRKTTALHLAVQARRAENVKALLTHGDGPGLLVKLRDKKGMTAMAYACEASDLSCIKVLIQEGGVKVNQGVGKDRMQPLGWAAAKGDYELCEWLLDNKARVIGVDKFKRSPLIMAVRNGHLKVASLLLQRGADWTQADSSSNTPLHFAAAYGWQDCIDLLLRAGAEINAENSWKVTPINIAMLKNHEGCVKKFISCPGVDVNCKDEKGRTLLTMALLDIGERTPKFLEYLLDKGADPNIADVDEQAALHYVANLDFERSRSWQETAEEWEARLKRKLELQLELVDLLLAHGASLDKKDSQKRTPFAVALERRNVLLLKKLIAGVSLNRDPQLLHALTPMILDTKYQALLHDLIAQDTPTSENMNQLDEQGLTPFLAYIEQFSSQSPSLGARMLELVNAEAVKHGKEFGKYEINIDSLFSNAAPQQQQYGGYGGRARAVKRAWPTSAKIPNSLNGGLFAGGLNGNNQAADLDGLNVVQDVVPIEKRKELTDERFMPALVVQPFVACLKMLVSKGADPNMRVQKLKRFRDLDEEQRKLLLVQEAQGANGQVRGHAKKEERALKRDEILRRQRYEATNKKETAKKKAKQPHGAKPNQTGAEGLGKRKENEYHETMGLQNAWHLAVACPHPKLIDLLVQLEVDPDAQDKKQITPFNLASTMPAGQGATARAHEDNLNQVLLSLGVKFDLPDCKGRTAFLNYFAASRMEQAELLLGLGADVNRIDVSGLFALKYLLIRRDGAGIEQLVKQHKANINQLDGRKRNCLHHAVNMSSASADATFETEQLLIDLGIEINHKDCHGRTPLHYAFVKIKDWRNSSQIDPIETVSSLCGIRGLETDVADNWKRTPLHYGSQRGASICAMYLEKRGANKEAIDIYGNTPLGVALLAGHHNFAIIMIQKAADVRKLVYREDPERIARMWKEQELKEKANKKGGQDEAEDEEMQDGSDEEEQIQDQKKKHRQAFQRKANMAQDSDDDSGYGESDDEASDGEDSDSQFEQHAFNTQNAFGVPVFGQAQRSRHVKHNAAYQYPPAGGGLFGGGVGGNPVPAPETNAGPGKPSEPTPPQSMFRIAVQHGQQGLAYLMLDEGYNLMHAMQDAMDEKKFQLVLTLLTKYPEDSVVQQKTQQAQNLFHILSQNAASCKPEHLNRIYDTLKRRGVDCLAVDGFGRTALHHAVQSRSHDLVIRLLQEGGASAASIDMHGHSPLTVYLKGKSAASVMLHVPTTGVFDPIFEALMTAGADVNLLYPEPDFEPAYKGEIKSLMKEHSAKYDESVYKTTILINMVRQLADSGEEEDEARLVANLRGLLQRGAKFNVHDSDGRDAMSYAVLNNNLGLVKFLIANGRLGLLVRDVQDYAGRSAAHLVVNPCKFGSYENVAILEELAAAGHELRCQDSAGKEPIQYAVAQESGTLLRTLAALTSQARYLEQFNQRTHESDGGDWPVCQVDFEADSALLLQTAAEKEEQQMADAEKQRELVPVDNCGAFEKSYSVFCEGMKPWDTYLTKVDLKNGIYGDYVFYKLQLLHDSVRDLYVVFTRWGRIGEAGMNQRTPFNNIDEAKKEYCNIFKSKTGNEFTDLENFQRVPKKYTVTNVNYTTVAHRDYLAPFDFDKAPKSKIERNARDLLEEVANITMYQRAMAKLGFNTDALPISCVNKEVILKARGILSEISDQVQADGELCKQGLGVDLAKLLEVRNKIQELSSRYYELIPLAAYKDQIAPPLASPQLLKAQYDGLSQLGDIEWASTILLGALYRQAEVHPADYLLQAMGIKIEYVLPASEEHKVLEQYVKNTAESQISWATHRLKIFKIGREGEAQAISPFMALGNRRLLFHGSSLFNFVGILSQGLRIAPPEAPATGYMFGKGIYLADMFSKSHSYSTLRASGTQESTLMLLCEAALGNSKKLIQAQQIETLPADQHSVHGLGAKGPDYARSLTLPDGVLVPNGKVKTYKLTDEMIQNQKKAAAAQAAQPQSNFNIGRAPRLFNPFNPQLQQQNPVSYHLGHNEFVVYNNAQVRMRYLLQIVPKTPEELRQN